MRLFTIDFELGPETRGLIERVTAEACATIEKVATSAVVQVELGPRTRETIEATGVASSKGGKARVAIDSLLGHGGEQK
jgi:hypothetical protein